MFRRSAAKHAQDRVDFWQQQARLTAELPCRSAVKHAHDGSVAGLAADASNKLLVSGGYDGVLRIWSFKQRRLLHQIPVGRPISKMCHHAGSALLSVATDDLLIRMCVLLSLFFSDDVLNAS